MEIKMQVKDLILYQVATDKNYKVGQVLEVGGQPNGQYHKCRNQDFLSKEGIVMHEAAHIYAHHDKKKNKNFELEMAKALLEYDFIMRELALEEVRKEKFPHMPSRFSCMFLSETAEECLKNFEEFKKLKKGACLQAIKVKVTGNAHFVRGGIGREGFSYNQYVLEAERYWREGVNTDRKVQEILFEGKVEVVEILSEIN